jgi:Fe-S-cluster containining protein
MSFFGAILLGSGPTEGGVLVIDDAVQGKLLKVELPGSCQPPDYEVCTVVEVRPAQCRKFDVKLERTSTEVNDIRLIDGHATLDCTFPEGGTLTAGVVFESCD